MGSVCAGLELLSRSRLHKDVSLSLIGWEPPCPPLAKNRYVACFMFQLDFWGRRAIVVYARPPPRGQNNSVGVSGASEFRGGASSTKIKTGTQAGSDSTEELSRGVCIGHEGRYGRAREASGGTCPRVSSREWDIWAGLGTGVGLGLVSHRDPLALGALITQDGAVLPAA